MMFAQPYLVAVAHATAGIPFKANTAVPAGSLAWAVLCTLFVLAGIVGGLLLAKRRGWLQTWIGPSPVAPKGADITLRVTSRARVSAATRAYVIENDGDSYLVFESSQHLVVHPKPKSSESDNAREK